MRLLAVVHGYVGGPTPLWAGAEHALHALLSHVASRGRTVHVAVTPGPYAPSGGYEIDGVQVLSGSETHGALWGRRYDVIATHLNATTTALHAADRASGGMPTVVLLHNHHDFTFQSMVQYLSFDRRRLVVANSEWITRLAQGVVEQRGLARRIGVMTARPMTSVADYQVHRERGRTVTLVNTAEKKGGVLLAHLAQRMPDVEFLAVTGAYGEQETDRYVKLTNVRVLPTMSNMRSVYAQTDVLMMGSTYESWGRVGVEAACSGIPTVSTPMPGPLEALGDTAMFVDVADLDGWERAIRSLLDDRVEYDRRAVLCQERAAQLEIEADIQREQFLINVERLIEGAG